MRLTLNHFIRLRSWPFWIKLKLKKAHNSLKPQTQAKNFNNSGKRTYFLELFLKCRDFFRLWTTLPNNLSPNNFGQICLVHLLKLGPISKPALKVPMMLSKILGLRDTELTINEASLLALKFQMLFVFFEFNHKNREDLWIQIIGSKGCHLV